MKSNMLNKALIRLMLALLLCSAAVLAHAEDAWLPEFEDICSKTDDSSVMTKEELKAMVERCDKLRPVIEKSENPQKKVYLFRLDKCKNLFAYVLEVIEK